MKTSPPRPWRPRPANRSRNNPARVSLQFETLGDLQDAFLKAQSDVWVEDCIADQAAGTLTFASLDGGAHPRLGGERFKPAGKLRH